MDLEGKCMNKKVVKDSCLVLSFFAFLLEQWKFVTEYTSFWTEEDMKQNIRTINIFDKITSYTIVVSQLFGLKLLVVLPSPKNLPISWRLFKLV